MSCVLEVEQVVKTYGQTQALQEASLQVREGTCFGLLGPNGAGKSTMMKLITGILQPDHGSIRVLGMQNRKQIETIRRQVGYVPQEITLHDELSAMQNLKFLGQMHGVRGAALQQRLNDGLSQVGLSERAKDRVGSYSGGMKRRVNLLGALLHQPKLVILDEPTVGIDPQSRHLIFEMIKALRSRGTTIIYSTHYMEEVEALCDDVAIIDHGRVIAQDSLHGLLDRHATRAVYVEAEGLELAPEVAGASEVAAKGRGWVLQSEEPVAVMEQLAARLGGEGRRVRALELLHPSLESVFLKLTGTQLRDG
ncbi:ATP-binding cassette domain-containing protein [Paenibacillus sp. 1P07SE]|uniref:ABC transporter ATP-binding protein n=1 Tax=Paenibacillus sp. 1P07SE TaxID=3132209 RepID=UPI0039A7601F